MNRARRRASQARSSAGGSGWGVREAAGHRHGDGLPELVAVLVLGLVEHLAHESFFDDRPADITATRSAMTWTSARSWEMKR